MKVDAKNANNAHQSYSFNLNGLKTVTNDICL